MRYLLKLLIISCLASGCASQPKSTPAEFLNKWLAAENAHDTTQLAPLYNDLVLFYGKENSRAQCLALKSSFYKANADYKVIMVGMPSITTIEIKYFNKAGADDEQKKLFGIEDSCRIVFVKEVTLKSSTKKYEAYLDLVKKDGAWKIMAESDKTTDANLARKGHATEQNTIEGDFNGDGKKETGHVWAPETTSDMECKGGCVVVVKFDNGLPDLTIDDAIGVYPTNLGDLNGNGTDELGLLRDWFAGCWQPFYVYTLINGKWVRAVEPIPTYCEQWDNNIQPIKKDSIDGRVIITYGELNDSDIDYKSRSVPIAR